MSRIPGMGRNRTQIKSGAWALVALLLAAAPLCAQLDSAAVVAESVGDVSVLRDGQPWALFSGDSIEVGQTIVTGTDGWARLAVADGSFFLVYPDSHVVFRKNPGSLRDLIDIFLGKVKVYIQHLGDRPNPHRVYSPTAVISVRGTTFLVSVEEDETTTVSVEEGLVDVKHQLFPSRKVTYVEAGQTLVIHPSVPLAKARVDGLRAVRIAEDVARTAASIWQRIGGGRGGNTGGGGASGGGSAPAPRPLPGDTEAPAPPPAPPD